MSRTPTRVHFEEDPEIQDSPSTPASTPNTSTELYEDPFKLAFSKIFTTKLLASLTTKDAILKEVRDRVLTKNEERCRQTSPYIHSFWPDLQVKSGCLCVEDRIALPHAIKDAYIDVLHSTNPGSWGITDMALHAWWPYMNRDLLTKTAKCAPCIKIGKYEIKLEMK